MVGVGFEPWVSRFEFSLLNIRPSSFDSKGCFVILSGLLFIKEADHKKQDDDVDEYPDDFEELDDEDDFDEESQKRPISFATLDEKEQDYEYADDFEEDSEEEVNKQKIIHLFWKKVKQTNWYSGGGK